MDASALAGETVTWDGHVLPPLGLGGELDFAAELKAAARADLPPPDDPGYPAAQSVLMDKFSAGDYCFAGPVCMRYLNSVPGQAHYLHFLIVRGWRSVKGRAANPPPLQDVARALRGERFADGGPRPWSDLFDRVVRRDFPFLFRGAGGGGESPPAGPATPGRSTPAPSPSCAASAAAPSATSGG